MITKKNNFYEIHVCIVIIGLQVSNSILLHVAARCFKFYPNRWRFQKKKIEITASAVFQSLAKKRIIIPKYYHYMNMKHATLTEYSNNMSEIIWNVSMSYANIVEMLFELAKRA